MAVRQQARRSTDHADSDMDALERAIDAFRTESGRGLDHTAVAWLKGRYLSEVHWFERKAEVAKRWHYALRIAALTGGVLVPALIAGSSQKGFGDLRFYASVLSVVVALAIGVDGFFHWGERWMRYRQTAEMLKTEGWSYLEGVGRFARSRADDPASKFSLFAASVEGAIHQDVAAFLTTIAREQPTNDQQPNGKQ
jgi:hypothetical protein